MKKQNQYQNLMFIIKTDGFADTNLSLKKYIAKYKYPIQIGTRLSDLCRSGYLTSTTIGRGRNVWTLTDKGTEWKDGEELVIKQYLKIKKTRAESEVKSQCKDINTEIINTNKGVPQHTIREHIKSILS